MTPRNANREARRKALAELHTAKLIHARLLGLNVDRQRGPTRLNVHRLQKLINEAKR